MRIVVAMGSFKGTIKSHAATDAVASVIQDVLRDASVEQLVLADGGEGTLETFAGHFGLPSVKHTVRNAVGTQVSASMGLLDDVAVIESSQAIGISLIEPSRLDPFVASSYGMGELIKHAIERGASKIFVTMGDSATMDVGVGMLYALGVKFYSDSGELLCPGLHNLHQIAEFDDTDLRRFRERATFIGLVDTNDYLCGKIGQVQLYGRQKGLRDSDIARVEASYCHFAKVIEKRFGVDVTKIVRCTGSGGLAAALHAFLGADLLNTLEYLSGRLQLGPSLLRADITVTGEGYLDNQTRLGKVPYFVARKSGNRCICVVGRYTQAGFNDMLHTCRQCSVFCLNPDIAMTNAKAALEAVARSIFSLVRS